MRGDSGDHVVRSPDSPWASRAPGHDHAGDVLGPPDHRRVVPDARRVSDGLDARAAFAGDIVIADNLGAHKVAGIQRALQAAGAPLWYVPPYSPDLNPIELCFAKLKALVRPARCRRSETLWPFLGECVAHFSPDECRNYVRHCGYSAATRS